jgi:rhamnose transport system permease protein
MSEPTARDHASRYTVADRAPFRLTDAVLRWETILVVLLAAVVVINTAISPYFLDLYNLSDATYNFSEKAIIALAMALLILVREIDLSVAAIVAVAALGIGYLAQAGHGPGVLILAGLLIGLACGMLNGALVTLTGVPSIVITIGTMSLFRGVAQVSLGDQALTTFPPEYLALGQTYAIDMPPTPLSFLLFLGLAIIFGLVLHFTALGRRLFAIGSNPVAARFSGIRVNRIRFVLFALSGTMAGLAAVLLTARIGVMRPNIALGWELDVITMVILGGVSIAGGVGSILGVVLAVFVLGFATFGLSLMNVPGIVINVLLGFLLILSIAAPIVVRRGLARRSATPGG